MGRLCGNEACSYLFKCVGGGSLFGPFLLPVCSPARGCSEGVPADCPPHLHLAAVTKDRGPTGHPGSRVLPLGQPTSQSWRQERSVAGPPRFSGQALCGKRRGVGSCLCCGGGGHRAGSLRPAHPNTTLSSASHTVRPSCRRMPEGRLLVAFSPHINRLLCSSDSPLPTN